MAGDPTLTTLSATHDRLLGGQLSFEQPVEGYRASVDGLLLAAFAGRASRLAVDLGAGTGMVTLALLARQAAPRVVAVERDEIMVALLKRNADANGFADRITVAHSDVVAFARAHRGSADLVVANPPFWSDKRATASVRPRVWSARASPGGGALLAFVQAARSLLGRGGRACFIWPAEDLEQLLAVAANAGLHAKRARFVHTLPSRPARRVLVEFKPGRPGGLQIQPPLLLFERPGVVSAEAEAITGRGA